MAQGNSGSFTLTGSQNFAVLIYWSETYNESANTHVVSITAAQLVSYNWYGFTYYPNGTLSINGSTVGDVQLRYWYTQLHHRFARHRLQHHPSKRFQLSCGSVVLRDHLRKRGRH